MAKAGKELYVGSLSYDVTEYELHKMFAVAGTVTSMHLITDAETGEFKGCGYVRMSTEAEAKDAIDSLDGAWLLDRHITVSYANPQKMKAGGGGLKGRFIPKWLDKNKDKEGAASAKPAKAKPAAAKTAGAKPATKQAGAKPASARPEATRPASAKPAGARPASARPASKPEGAKPAAARTAAPAKSRAAKPAGTKPAARTAGAKPGSARPAAKPGSRSGKR